MTSVLSWSVARNGERRRQIPAASPRQRARVGPPTDLTTASVAQILELQRCAGNEAVCHALGKDGCETVSRLLDVEAPPGFAEPAEKGHSGTVGPTFSKGCDFVLPPGPVLLSGDKPEDRADIMWIEDLHTPSDIQDQIDVTYSKGKEAQATRVMNKKGLDRIAACKVQEQKRIKAIKDPAARAEAQGQSDTRLAQLNDELTTVLTAEMQRFDTERVANRRKFMSSMRCYLGSDAKTKSHFQNLVLAKVPGYVYCHRSTADRLEKVRDVLLSKYGVDMPYSDVGQSLRDRHLRPNSTGMMGHPLGFSVDYLPYDNPKIADPRLAALLGLITNDTTSIQLHDEKGKDLGYGSRRQIIHELGRQSMGETVDPKVAAQFKPFLDEFEKQFDKVAKASKDFTESLPQENRDHLATLKERYIFITGRLPQLAADLAALKKEMAAARGMPDEQAARKAELEGEKAALTTEFNQLPDRLGEIFKPWLDKIQAKVDAIEAEAKGAGVDIDHLPSGKKLEQARTLALQMLKAKPARAAALDRQIAALIDQGLIGGSAGSTAADRLKNIKRLGPWVYDKAKKRKERGVWKWLANSLRDVGFVFVGKVSEPNKAPTADKVLDPGVSQLVEKGFFNPREDLKDPKQKFNYTFFKTMVEFGFDPGVAWGPGSTDPMHFDFVQGFDEFVVTPGQTCGP
jgi:hypothetical protein